MPPHARAFVTIVAGERHRYGSDLAGETGEGLSRAVTGILAYPKRPPAAADDERLRITNASGYFCEDGRLYLREHGCSQSRSDGQTQDGCCGESGRTRKQPHCIAWIANGIKAMPATRARQ